LQNSGVALELIVNQLPEPNSDSNQVLRKRLQQWINQGLLKLYQTQETGCLTLYLSTQQSERVALQLQYDAEGKPSVWFQTRSRAGVEQVLGTLEKMRSHSRLVPTAELEDPSTVIHFLEPSCRHLTLSELRQELGLEQVLAGSKVERVTYRDRYLKGKEAKILLELLREELAPSAQVKIWVLENAKEQFASERKSDLEAVLREVEEMGVSCQAIVQPQHHSKHFPHPRILEIQRQDGRQYKVVFDMGLDFLEARGDTTYSVTKPTYVVVTFR
jgi:hypothetical protein